MAGLTPQISEVPAQIVLDEFLLEAKIRIVGVLDDSLNNEDHTYVSVTEGVATPWRQNNPIKPIGYEEGVLRIEDILMVYPTDPSVQAKIKLLSRAERVILYVGPFAIYGNLSMGPDTGLSSVMDALPKRFLAITEVSVFCMFPARAAMPRVMPVALLNRSKVSHFHSCR